MLERYKRFIVWGAIYYVVLVAMWCAERGIYLPVGWLLGWLKGASDKLEVEA